MSTSTGATAVERQQKLQQSGVEQTQSNKPTTMCWVRVIYSRITARSQNNQVKEQVFNDIHRAIVLVRLRVKQSVVAWHSTLAYLQHLAACTDDELEAVVESALYDWREVSSPGVDSDLAYHVDALIWSPSEITNNVRVVATQENLRPICGQVVLLSQQLPCNFLCSLGESDL